MIKVKRALISVSDKTGLAEFARGLKALGVEILSTGGTARLLKSAGLEVTEVGEYTGSPEILDGRVKTLHPRIHGGLLALRDKPEHLAQLKEHDIGLIDMVVVNLYPFERVVRKKQVALEEALENIDIGGPSMLRSAAKNFKSVAVVCNPDRYKEILNELDVNSGLLSDTVLLNLAIEAFGHTARYDGIIFEYLNGRRQEGFSEFPKEMTLRLTRSRDLRYGENPHQAAALFQSDEPARGLAGLKQLHGKELSFNNLLDLQAALNIVRDFDEPAAVVIKHNNPTGIAQSADLARAFVQAHQCDSLSAFGGIVGCNRKIDEVTAERIAKSGFMECVIAPGYERAALKILKQKKNLRLIQLKMNRREGAVYDLKQIDGGLLVQERDVKDIAAADLKVVTRKKPTQSQIAAMLFGWKAVKHVKSNAIILVKGSRTVGIGCGQTSRVEAARIAIRKAGKAVKSSVFVSDAFIPKTDNVALAARAGVSAIIQTGGSIADTDVIAAADKAGLAMVLTGVRHFKH